MSGPYAVQPDTSLPPFTVCCDMDTDGGGWTVFQRRIDTADFYRDWEYYKNGFGTVCGSFWLGLDNIHQLTKWKIAPHELRVDLWDWEGNTVYAKYQSFWIGGASSSYALFIDGHSGSAPNALIWHNGRKFTTRDRDNDLHETGNCAIYNSGAWWFNKCYSSHLNGPYSTSSRVERWIGVQWLPWKGDYYSLKRAEMKVRPNSATCQTV